MKIIEKINTIYKVSNNTTRTGNEINSNQINIRLDEYNLF